MKQKNQELVIILPESMEDVPVRIVRDEKVDELNIQIITSPDDKRFSLATEKKHALIWHKNEYKHISLDEIIWIEANSSYCDIHATEERKFTLSFPLARIEERLPKEQFIRIQRSYLVNINHVKSLIGHSLIVDKKVLKIGGSYIDKTLDEFIFLGVRNQQPRKYISKKRK